MGSFLLWSSLAQLDKGVPLNGTVTVASNKKAIQHETGGTVEAILVKEGDNVQAGDVLVRMNNVQAQSNPETVRVQYITARTTQARLEAERDHKVGIKLPAEFALKELDVHITENLAIQKQIASARQAALNSELSAIDENIAGLVSQMDGLEQSVVSKREQKASIAEQLVGMRDLANEGYMATNRVLESEQGLA